MLAACVSARAVSAESQWRSVPGPVPARIVRIIDGDTLVVDAHPWPGQAVRVSVRLRGIDTPERRSRCKSERLAADRARVELERLVEGIETLELINVSGGKYYGRVLADIRAGARDIASAMLDSGLARPYQGGKRQRAKCTDPQT
ncbi:thermonuclease family protein [Hoeflea sp. G2-23]|uniref:Thermonuclease family protein n=1 Tax=Hoeflea algicola TaxID=2983763 RepID=A0ABT3ZB55_9HYPH|nr:thermonuclease family protein [Hoeflea algicola]MCY0149040.1 thermonuclease family protein [Hoeflea algicola]